MAIIQQPHKYLGRRNKRTHTKPPHLFLLDAVRVAIPRANIAQILTHVDDFDEELNVAHLLLAPHDVVLQVEVQQHLCVRGCASVRVGRTWQGMINES